MWKINYFLITNYGFRSGHSTELAALELTDRIISALDNHNTPLNIFLDLSKAFDTLDHTILSDKLLYYGIRGTAYNLLRSYLANREQFVELNDTASKTLHIVTGVPQGSILGPLLFLICVQLRSWVQKVLHIPIKIKVVVFYFKLYKYIV